MIIYSAVVMKKLSILIICFALIVIACQIASQPETSTPALSASATLTPQQASDPILIVPTITAAPTETPTPTIAPQVRVADGDEAIFEGDLESALAAYEKASTAADPVVQAAALTGLGRAYLLSGDTDNALRFLRQVVESHPQDPISAEANFFLAQTYEKLSRPVDAAQAYMDYLLLHPGILDAYVYEKRGDLLTQSGDFAAALGEYQAAVNSPRLHTDYSLEIKLARAYAHTGDYATALVMYDDIFNKTSSDYTRAQLDYLKAQAYTAQGNPSAAQAAYLDAVQNYPTAYDSYQALVELVNAGYPVDDLLRGIVDYYAGEYGVALAAFDRYLSDSPNDPARAYYYKGLCLRAQNNPSAALEFWDQVIQNYPSSQVLDRAYEQKGYTQWAFLDEYAEARQTLVDFVNAVPNHPRAAEFLFDAAQVAERNGDLADAVALWERLPADYPLSPLAYNAIFQAGLGEYRQGNYPAAQAIFSRAQATAANVVDSSQSLFWVAKTYQAMGDVETATRLWNQTAGLDPTGYYSERALDVVANRPAFDPPPAFDLGHDANAEYQQALQWMRTTFSLPADVDLSSPGLLANDPYFKRGQELWRLGLYNQASEEFDSLRTLIQSDAAACFRLAGALEKLGAFRPAILAARQVLTLARLDDAASLSAPMYFNHIRFGTYYSSLVIPEARAYGLHPFLIWSLMRQESFFDRSIVSSAGARGLMQIMPATGQDIVNRMNWPAGYSDESLDSPFISIKLGINYLNSIQQYLDGDLFAAIAAYNSGPGNAAAWKDLAHNDPDLFLEVIRLDEPKRYVKGIYEMFNIYRRLYGRIP